jgi:hypothetical protein
MALTLYGQDLIESPNTEVINPASNEKTNSRNYLLYRTDVNRHVFLGKLLNRLKMEHAPNLSAFRSLGLKRKGTCSSANRIPHLARNHHSCVDTKEHCLRMTYHSIFCPYSPIAPIIGSLLSFPLAEIKEDPFIEQR